MLAAERRSAIRELVQRQKSASVSELAERFSVTDETIRRDLRVLESEGILTRTYGGAFVQSGVENLLAAELRKTLYVEEKKLIASRCRSLINEGDTIFLDNSTTCFHIAEAISEMNVTVVTNNLAIVNLFSRSDNIRLVCIGGELSIPEQAFHGSIALKMISEYFFDKAFISCRTLSIENGVTESTDQWAQLRHLVIEHSDEHYLAADHTKFGRTSFVRISGFDKITAIITDRPLEPDWHAVAERVGCAIIDGSKSKQQDK